MATATAPGLPEIERARERLDGVARVTPVYPTETFSRLAGRPVFLKAENLQRTGSFKIRGAYVKLSSLEPERLAAGVIASSAGNHGQAVAWAARELGAPARIFMPQDSPMAKVDATRSYGAEVELVGSSFEETLEEALAYVASTDGTFIHPYEDTHVIAGQGTIGLEIAEQVDELETVVIPIGGGGLASGISLALRAVRPGLRIVGVQAAGTRPGGSGYTIADGIAVKQPGELTMGILGETLDDIVAVEDEQIAEAIVLLAERTKFVVEGAGAVATAAILGGLVGGSGSALALLSGGNIDASLMVQVMRRGLALSGRYLAPADARDRPSRRAREAARPTRRRARERRRGRAPARGGRHPGRLHRRRAHAAHARFRALRAAAHAAGRVGLPGRAARLSRRFDELPGLIEAKLAEHARVVLVYFDAFGWRFLERHADHPLFAGAEVERWSSCFPSTTTVHSTTIHSGLPLGEHGLYEWNVFEPRLNRLVTPLWFCFAGDERPGTLFDAGFTAHDLFPDETLYRRLLPIPSHVAMPSGIARSSTSQLLLQPATVHPFDDERGRPRPAGRCARCRGACVRDDLSRRRWTR